MPAGLPHFYPLAQKDAPFHFELWVKQTRLSCQHDSAAVTSSFHIELLNLMLTVYHYHYRSLLRNFIKDKDTKHSLCIASRSVTQIQLLQLNLRTEIKCKLGVSINLTIFTHTHTFFKGK